MVCGVIECTERDAPYVLDGLLYHESDIDPVEHYTDTQGVIALFPIACSGSGKRDRDERLTSSRHE